MKAPEGSATPVRSIMIGSALGAGVFLILMALPGGGLGGGAGRGAGTPFGIIFSGIVLGLLNGMIAAGIVLLYRSARVINFAQAAIGSFGGAFTFHLIQLNRWPFVFAFITGIGVSVFVGILIEVGIIRRFFFAPRLAVTVLTIALANLLGGASSFVQTLPIFPQDITFTDLTAPLTLPFQSFSFQLGALPLRFGFGHVFAIAMSVLSLGALAFFLRYTRVGTAIRASAENAERAELLGISAKALSTLVWTLAAVLSSLGVILTGTVTRFATVSGLAPGSLLPALVAALIGRMKSINSAVMAAVGLTVLREAVRWSYENLVGLIDVGLFVVIVVTLLIQRRELNRGSSDDTLSWRATEEIRPTPKQIMDISGVRIWRRILIAVGVAFVLLYPWVTSPATTNFGGFMALNAIVLLSLVVLTGWAGQVSLGQFAFVAIGAIVGGAMTARWGIPFLLAVLFASILTSALSVLIGIPALRIRGLFLAVATFALAFAVESALFNESYFGWLLPDRVARPALFLIDFEDERSMYYLSVGCLLLAITVVGVLRRFRTGRVLIGVRENDTNLESLGIGVVRAKLLAFAISGFLCGFAGVLMAHHQRAVSVSSFRAQESLDVFLLAAVGGISSVSGPLLGTAYSALRRVLSLDILAFLVGPVGTLFVLYLYPGGLASMAYGFRDSIYRILAQRRRIVVPSLIPAQSRHDPESALVPLAEIIPNSGLQAVTNAARYEPRSRMYGLDNQALVNGYSAVESHEIQAISAATEGLEASGEEAPPQGQVKQESRST